MANQTFNSLEVARDLAGRGFPVFPIQPKSKMPIGGESWKNLIGRSVDAATTEFTKPGREHSNVAVACGADLLVVDVDEGKHPGALESYLKLGPPQTFSVRTPSGGYHFYFRGPDVSNSASKIAPGIDIRSAGGYVVAPGSVTDLGVYKVDKDIEIARAPENLLALCNASRGGGDPRAVDWTTRDTPEGRLAHAREYLCDARTPISVEGCGGDNTAFEVIAGLWDRGVCAAQALELVQEDWNERCLPPWDFNDLRRFVTNVYSYAKGPFGGRAPDVIFGPVVLPSNEPERVIEIKGGNLPAEADAGEDALIAAGAPVFSRAGDIVRPYGVETAAFKGGFTHHAVLQVLNATALVDELTSVARWERYDMRSRRNVPVNAPKHVAETIISRRGKVRLPKLASVISTQTLRPDGSILRDVGYDAATRLFLMAPPDLPAIPDHPTREDAEAALRVLKDLLVEFPFTFPVAHAVALSAITTTVCRGIAKVVPMHVSTAPAAGTGKSYLWDIVSMIATGQCCPVTAMPNSADELEKRIDGSLLEGSPIICIDNVNGELSGDKLCQAIERPVVEVRRLGASEKQKIDNRTTFLATGNNIVLRGDLTRRALLASLDARTARPELRQFKSNPVQKIANDRGRYIAAALTIVRAYVVAGRPNPLPTLASFETWSDNIRSALVWLGCVDPVDSMTLTREEDPEMIVRREIFTAIRKDFPNGATVRMMLGFQASEGSSFNGLRECVTEHLGGKGSNLSDVLGKWLRANKGRIVAYEGEELFLDGSDKAAGGLVKWQIRPA